MIKGHRNVCVGAGRAQDVEFGRLISPRTFTRANASPRTDPNDFPRVITTASTTPRHSNGSRSPPGLSTQVLSSPTSLCKGLWRIHATSTCAVADMGDAIRWPWCWHRPHLSPCHRCSAARPPPLRSPSILAQPPLTPAPRPAAHSTQTTPHPHSVLEPPHLQTHSHMG